MPSAGLRHTSILRFVPAARIEVGVIEPARDQEAVVAIVLDLAAGFVLRDDQHRQMQRRVEEEQALTAARQERIDARRNDV